MELCSDLKENKENHQQVPNEKNFIQINCLTSLFNFFSMFQNLKELKVKILVIYHLLKRGQANNKIFHTDITYGKTIHAIPQKNKATYLREIESFYMIIKGLCFL